MSEARIIHGDCLEVLPTLQSGSVDAVVTSPPYDSMRQYRGVAAFVFIPLASELFRVVANGGVVVWVVGDGVKDGSESGTSCRQALGFMDVGFRLHDTMIYAKKNPVPRSIASHRRYEQAFEFMFVFSKGRPKTFNGLREPCKEAGKVRATGPTHRGSGHDPIRFNGAGRPIGETKPRGNIWYYSVKHVKAIGHPATFPVQLAIDHVKTWTLHGDIVLDPFAGSGTTGVACLREGRSFIGVEQEAGYVEIARKRLAEEEAKQPLFAGTKR